MSNLAKHQEPIHFEVETIEWKRKNRNYVSKPYRSVNYQLIIVSRGSGSQIVDASNISIQDNTAYLVVPGQLHLFAPDNHITGYVISFSEEFVLLDKENRVCLKKLGALHQSFTPIILRFTDELKADVNDTVNRLIKEFSNYYTLRSEVLRGLLKLLLIDLTRHSIYGEEVPRQSKAMETINAFHSLLEKYFKNKKMVSEYADMLAVSASHLNDLHKQTMGTAASECIKDRVILEARRMAMQTNNTMKEIAFDLGFETPAHFSKYFKNNSGLTFSEFKNGFLETSEASSFSLQQVP